MQDINHARTPILTLAMSVGFNSLAPFNRAFLKQVKRTPTEFRRQHQNTPNKT
ncbi:MAG: AraC-like DNA-binding protein [Arenicella sp.]|jgi:AraC-like DNA-binding protein